MKTKRNRAPERRKRRKKCDVQKPHVRKNDGEMEQFLQAWPDYCKAVGFYKGYSILALKALARALENSAIMRFCMGDEKYEKFIRKRESRDEFILHYWKGNPEIPLDKYQRWADEYSGKIKKVTLMELYKEQHRIRNRIFLYRRKKQTENLNLAQARLERNKLKIAFIQELRKRGEV